MRSRKSMLEQVRKNQPALVVLPTIFTEERDIQNIVETFCAVLAGIGGKAILVNSVREIRSYIEANICALGRIVSTVPELNISLENDLFRSKPHDLKDVELAIINGHFAVAENGAVWITEELIQHRVLPFICQHLIIIIHEKDIVDTMHHAYDRITNDSYGYGTFISGPSKTADIEQSLVLGAHGPKTATVFIMAKDLG